MIDKIELFLQEWEDSKVISLWNIYCDLNNFYDDQVYDMDSFDELNQGLTPITLALRISFGHEFNPCHTWWWVNAYGNYESFDYVTEHSNNPIYLWDLADSIYKNPEEYEPYIYINKYKELITDGFEN